MSSTKSTNIKKKQFLEVFEKKAANITLTCKAIQIDRKTYYNWYNNDEEFRQKVDEVRESLIDFTESKLMELIQEGNVVAILFFLKTIGKNRGYVEKQEIEIDKIESIKKIEEEITKMANGYKKTG